MGKVRGSSTIKERAWGSGRGKNFRKYRIEQREWIYRLNYVRNKIGTGEVARRAGVSTTDPTFKTVRRWASGDRIPDRSVYELINRLYTILYKKELIPLKDIIYKSMLSKGARNWDSKVDLFIRRLGNFSFINKATKKGLHPSPMVAHKWQDTYLQTLNAEGKVNGQTNKAIVFIGLYYQDVRIPKEQMEAYYLTREDRPSPELMKNYIDTWIDNLPEIYFDNETEYGSMVITGVYWSYV